MSGELHVFLDIDRGFAIGTKVADFEIRAEIRGNKRKKLGDRRVNVV